MNAYLNSKTAARNAETRRLGEVYTDAMRLFLIQPTADNRALMQEANDRWIAARADNQRADLARLAA